MTRLAEVCERYGVAELSLFGSVARGTATESSDIDVLYVLASGRALGFAINRLEDELSEPFGRRVDLDSLLWNFTVLGEAANQVSTELKAQSPELPWADASRTRIRIVHGYWSVDFEVLAAIAREDLPGDAVLAESVLALSSQVSRPGGRYAGVARPSEVQPKALGSLGCW